MLSDREQRQLEQPVALEVMFDAAQRVGAGDDDGAVECFHIIVEGDRLEPQHRRLQHLETPGAQAGGGGLVVRLRAGDENSHASASKAHCCYINGRLHFATSHCNRGIPERRFGR